MKVFSVLALMVFILITGLSSFCFAAGEVATPKQEMTFDNSGPYKHLIGVWSGNLKNQMYKYDSFNWDFDLYVNSISEGKSEGFYCWSASKNSKPGCRKVQGTIDTAEEKLVFQWDDKVMKLLRTGKVIYTGKRGSVYEGIATRFEKK